MRNYWIVAKYEYRRFVVKRSFLIGILVVPLAIALLIGMSYLVYGTGQNKLPIAYIDQANFLKVELQANLPDPEKRIKILAYPDEASAQAALIAREIQAFFIFPPDYFTTLKTGLYYLDKTPSRDVWSQFDDFVRLNLVTRLPQAVQQRVLEGPKVTVIDITNNRQFSNEALINILLPIVASIFFFVSTMSTSGYMLQVVTDEKENRTMEIMVTSLTPLQMIGGKTLGLLGAALTQIAVYLVAAAVAIKVGAPYLDFLQQLTIPWTYLGIMALFFFPAFALIAAIMVAIGGIVGETQQGQQIAGLLNILFMLPLLTLVILMENPSHPLVLFMTFFPPSAFLTISLRWGFSSVPYWQIAVSWILLVTSTLGMVWVAARLFRAGMLHYGQPFNFKAIMAALKESKGGVG